MVKVLNQNNNEQLDLRYINKTIINIGKILRNYEIHNKSEFILWLKDFEKIYGKKQVNLHLYIYFALIYFIGYVFISKCILNHKGLLKLNRISLKILKIIEEDLKKNYINLNIFDIKYFNPFLSFLDNKDLSVFNDLILKVSNYVFKLDINPEYFFDYLIQTIISPSIRHKSGEYYTPPFLVKQMVEESYSFGDYILDPCCGSGNFLTQVVKHILSQQEPIEKKIKAINNIYGYDINPFSIYISKINLFYLLKEEIARVKLNLYVFDSLFQKEVDLNKKFDLIIGNPPWYTYRDIETNEYQEKVKKLSEQLELKPLPKNLLNLEISTLFFVNAKKIFMKEGAKIFFVMTKGVITGSHASRFRNFRGFTNLKIWTFDKRIETLFNIDFICIYGEKDKIQNHKSKEEIKAYHFILKNEIGSIGYFKDIALKLEKVELLMPYLIEEKAGKRYTKKLISQEKLNLLYPLKESYYKPLFHKGADLNPRNLIFIQFNRIDNSLAKINPDNRIFKRAKAPWNRSEFKNETIETKYIFKIVKSTELVKFYVYDHYHVFLPLRKTDLEFNYEKLAKFGKLFYNKINQLYLKYKKDTTKHESLIENLDRWSKLINLRQLSKIKVVYNNSGATLNSAVVQGDFLITGDLSFYDTNDLEEAFYLSAILNSNLMTTQVDIIRSSRHIFKLPLDFPIEKFNNENPTHQKLAELGKKGQLITKQAIQALDKNMKTNFTKNKIQSIVNEKLTSIFSQIDEILILELQEGKILK